MNISNKITETARITLTEDLFFPLLTVLIVVVAGDNSHDVPPCATSAHDFFIQAIGHDQVYFAAQKSNNLEQWGSEEVEYRGRINNGDGTETVRFQINNSVKSLGRSQLLRLLVKEEP